MGGFCYPERNDLPDLGMAGSGDSCAPRENPGHPEELGDVKLAEFSLEHNRDVTLAGQRARLLGSLAGLPNKRTTGLGKAVSEVTRRVLSHGRGEIEFHVSAEGDRSFVAVVVRAQPMPREPRLPGSAPETSALPPDDPAWVQAKSWVDRFSVVGRADGATVVRLGQEVPSSVPLDEDILADWGIVLASRSTQQALVASFQRVLELNRQLSVAHRQGLHLQEELQSLKSADEQQSLLSLVASKTDSAVVILDRQGLVEWVNDGFVRMTGYALGEVVGRRSRDVLHGPLTDPVTVRELDEAIRNGHGLTWEILHYRKDGKRYWASGSISPVLDENQRLTHTIAIFTDVTRRRQAQEALEQAKEAAEAASRAKSEFLANMSHEIRTPMNAIIGMTELTLCTELSPDQRQYLGTVKESAESLLRLLNDILDLSKIEAGRMEIEAVAFSLTDLLGETMKALAVRAAQKGLELAWHVPPAVPQHLVGDPVRLRQVLINLVGNAIKFTQKGEVVVRVEPEWQTDDEVALHFSVGDTGIGIPSDRLEQIFEAFRQADSSTTRRFGGTGLGLTISSQLIELMDGKIWVQSKVGKGSTFHFSVRLKLQTQAPATHPKVDAGSLAGTAVLVVDDNATNRLILKEYLLGWGMRPTVVASADKALEEVRKANARGCPFTLVVSDAVMPGTDGFELARQIGRHGGTTVPTIMMLSSADRPRQPGDGGPDHVAACLTKPVGPIELQRAILAALGRSAPPGAPDPTAEPSKAPSHVLRVVVADDNMANRVLAAAILQKRGHHVVAVGSGQETLAVLDREPVDVVVLDVQMPEMDGFAATAAIRRRESLTGAHLPIVAMTAYAMKGDRERCLAAGMDAYLAKPIRAHELQAVVESLGMAAIGMPADFVPGVRAAPFDFAPALARLEGDAELLKTQMAFFLSDAPDLVAKIGAALADRDGRALELAAHRLAGLVGNFDAESALGHSHALESMGSRRDFSQAETVYRDLATEIDRLREAVERYLAVRGPEPPPCDTSGLA